MKTIWIVFIVIIPILILLSIVTILSLSKDNIESLRKEYESSIGIKSTTFHPMEKNTTIIIKTFLRPKCIIRCVKNIRKNLPNIPILVADDSSKELMLYPKETTLDNVTWIPLPFDSGISRGRNLLVSRVKTKYTILLDDDIIFDKNPLPPLWECITRLNVQIVCGNEKIKSNEHNYMALFEEKGKHLKVTSFAPYIEPHILESERGLNYFIAKTSMLKENPWIDKLKVREHTAFFLELKRKGIKTYIKDDVYFMNVRNCASKKYKAFRTRKTITADSIKSALNLDSMEIDSTFANNLPKAQRLQYSLRHAKQGLRYHKIMFFAKNNNSKELYLKQSLSENNLKDILEGFGLKKVRSKRNKVSFKHKNYNVIIDIFIS